MTNRLELKWFSFRGKGSDNKYKNKYKLGYLPDTGWKKHLGYNKFSFKASLEQDKVNNVISKSIFMIKT